MRGQEAFTHSYVVMGPTEKQSNYTELFEMIVGVLTISFSRCNPMWFLSMGLRQGSGLCSSSSRQVSRNWRYESEPPLKPSSLTYEQFGMNSIIVFLFVESQGVHI